jgi:hypothetical protein
VLNQGIGHFALRNSTISFGSSSTWGAYIWDDVVNRTPRDRKELFLHAADGRYWVRLEWRALARALRGFGEARRLPVRDALSFRQARRMLYPAGVEDERGPGDHGRAVPAGTPARQRFLRPRSSVRKRAAGASGTGCDRLEDFGGRFGYVLDARVHT